MRDGVSDVWESGTSTDPDLEWSLFVPEDRRATVEVWRRAGVQAISSEDIVCWMKAMSKRVVLASGPRQLSCAICCLNVGRCKECMGVDTAAGRSVVLGMRVGPDIAVYPKPPLERARRIQALLTLLGMPCVGDTDRPEVCRRWGLLICIADPSQAQTTIDCSSYV